MSMYPASLNGYFNSDLPTRTPSVSAETLKVSLGTSADARVVQETFVKGRGGLRDPNLTNYIFPSYSQETYSPFKVYRNGVRQLPGDTDYKFWPGGWILRGTGPDNRPGMVASSSDGVKLAVCDQIRDVIQVSTDSGTTWEDRDALGDPDGVAISGDGSVLVALRGDSTKNLYVSTDLGESWTQLDNSSSYAYTRVAVSKDGDSILAATMTGELVDFVYAGGWSAGMVGSGYPASHTWSSVAVNSDGTRFVALSINGGVYTKQYQADPWAVSVSRVFNIGTVNVSDDGLVILFVAHGMLAQLSIDGGSSWSTIGTNAAGMYGALSADGTKMFISARDSSLLYSEDSGASWVTDAYIDHITSMAGSSDLVKIVAARYISGLTYWYTRNGFGLTPLVFAAETISAGENITIEYLTESTTLLPTLYPNN